MAYTCPTCFLRFEKKDQMNRHQKYHRDGDGPHNPLCYTPWPLGCKTAPTIRRVMPGFYKLNCITCDKIGGAQ